MDEIEDEAPLNILAAAASTSLEACESNGFYYVAGWAEFKSIAGVVCLNSHSGYTKSEDLDVDSASTLTIRIRSFEKKRKIIRKCH